MLLVQVGGKMSSLRQVQQGRSYQLPPITSGISPSLDESLSDWRSNVTQAAQLVASQQRDGKKQGSGSGSGRLEPVQPSKSAAAQGALTSSGRAPRVLDGCVRAYNGVSPALVEELCANAGISQVASPLQLTDEQWEKLFEQWQSWMSRLSTGNFQPTMDATGDKYSVLGGPAGEAFFLHLCSFLDRIFQSN